MLKRLIFVSFILVLSSACQPVAIAEGTAPIATVTLQPLPTFTPSSTLQPPESAGFPYIAALNDALPKEDLILARHTYGDPVENFQGDEFCYDIGIYADDSYIVISCLEGFVYPAPNGKLDAYQSKFLHRWVDTFQSYDEPSIHGLLVFTGRGESAPGYSDVVSMQAMIGELEWTAHEYVHRGGTPSVVPLAREILSHQLKKWLDDSSVFHFEAVDFPGSCLGAPKPNEICEQVVTQGFRIQLVADGMMYEFHTDVFGYDIRPFGEPQIAPTQGAGG